MRFTKKINRQENNFILFDQLEEEMEVEAKVDIQLSRLGA